MAKTVRVNLSVPAEWDLVLTGLAKAQAVSKASLVMAQMARALPYWRRDLAALVRTGVSSRPAVVSAPPGADVVKALKPKRVRSQKRFTDKDRERAEWNARIVAERGSKKKGA